MPEGYILIFFWTITALGAALLLGTGAALVRYVRTGRLPGQSAEAAATPTPEVLRRAVLRCGVGLAVVCAGVAGVVSAGG